MKKKIKILEKIMYLLFGLDVLLMTINFLWFVFTSHLNIVIHALVVIIAIPFLGILMLLIKSNHKWE